MRKFLVLYSAVLAAILMMAAPMTVHAMGHGAHLMVPAGYRTINVEYTGIDNISMMDGTLGLRVNGVVDVNDVITLIDDQLAYGGSVEESCTTRMRWVPGSTRVVSASGSTLNLQSTLALAQRTCEPSMSMYTTSEHAVDYSISVSGSGIDDLRLDLDVSSIAGLSPDSSLSAGRLDQIADANINPVQDWIRAVAKFYQSGCLETADVSISPLTFSGDGSVTVGVNAAGNLAHMAQCVIVPSEFSDLVTGTDVLPLILGDVQPATVVSILDGVFMAQAMSVQDYVTTVADDLADNTWKAIVVEALSVEFVQQQVMGGMGDMIPMELSAQLFSDAALEQIWGDLLLNDISADTLKGLVLALTSGMGDVNALAGDLMSQVQPSTIALALARLLTMG